MNRERGKNMKKVLIIIAILLLVVTGCRQSETVSRNISEEADKFQTYRRIALINLVSGEILLEIKGYCSVLVDSDDDVNVICEIDKNKYQKHIFHLTELTSYLVEQLDNSNVSAYHYKITIRPSTLIPEFELDIE